MFTLAVKRRDRNYVERWRTYRTLKLALHHGRRNLKAGHLCWIER